jgi:carboxyl-terminal processing protease
VLDAAEPVHPEVFSEVWTTVRDQFYDPNLGAVDWNAARSEYGPQAAAAKNTAELSHVINAMLGELRSSHTAYYTPSDPEYYQLAAIFQIDGLGERTSNKSGRVYPYPSIGILTSTTEGLTYVRAVLDGSPAARAGVLLGDRIVSADGLPFRPVESLRGRGEVDLLVERTAGGDPRTIRVAPVLVDPHDELTAALEASARVLERSGRALAYVHVWSYAGQPYQDALGHALESPALAAADGLLLDLRDGWGGASRDYLNLFNCRLPIMTGRSRDGRESSDARCWSKPVVLLVDGRSRSGKELFAYGFRKYGYGKIVGTRTAGAVLAGKLVKLTDDSLLYLAVTDVLVDGERLEGVGVAPDVEVPFDVRYAAGRDPQLERAAEVLVDELARPAR